MMNGNVHTHYYSSAEIQNYLQINFLIHGDSVMIRYNDRGDVVFDTDTRNWDNHIGCLRLSDVESAYNGDEFLLADLAYAVRKMCEGEFQEYHGPLDYWSARYNLQKIHKDPSSFLEKIDAAYPYESYDPKAKKLTADLAYAVRKFTRMGANFSDRE